MNRTNHQTIVPAILYATGNKIASNTTLAGGAVDTQGCDALSVLAEFGVNAETVSGGLTEVALQHSDDTVSGNFVDIPDANLTSTITKSSTVTGAAATGVIAKCTGTSDDERQVIVGVKECKRYIRAKFNVEKAQTIGIPIALTVLKTKLNNLP